jgi:hypothetical protein
MEAVKRDDICGATQLSPSGVELMCFQPKHELPQPSKSSYFFRTIRSEVSSHVFQTRYPYRSKEAY